MITHLQREIENLKKKVLHMSAEAEESLRKAVDSLVKRDARMAQEVIDGDAEMDRLEVEIEEECLKILALHQPVAIDLRYVVAVLKINSDLERIGDEAANVAERAAYLAAHPLIDLPLDFYGMATAVQSMVSRSIDSLVNLDSKVAREVRASDDIIDDMNRHMYTVIQDYIKEHPERVMESVHLLSVSRHLERIGDQATNIAEDVIYMVEGEIVRHQPEDFSQVLDRS